MSGLYNMLMGRNSYSPLLLAAVGIRQENVHDYPVGRIRDTWLSDDAAEVKVLHRNYGEDGAEINANMATHPNFIRHEMCNDKTYQYWVFRVLPELLQEPAITRLRQIVEDSDRMEPMDRYLHAIASLGDGKDNPQTRHMKKVGKGIVQAIMGEEKDVTVKNDLGSVEVKRIVPE